MVSTRSLIQWTNNLPNKESYHGAPIINYVGRVKGCDIVVNIYGHTGYWNWTIRSKQRQHNLIVGSDSSATLKGAKKIAAKFAAVQLLREIDATILRKKRYGYNTFCGFKPIER